MSERDSICATIERLAAVGIRVRPSGNDLVVGKRVNRLTPDGWQFRMTANWFVVSRCECGRYCISRVADIKRGAQESCGCKRDEATAASGRLNVKHGGRYTRLYRIWKNMKARCENPTDKNFPEYGGRGIRVCEEWLEFASFQDWAMANGYAESLTIDRYPDRNGGYSPGNCRWATYTQQSHNRDSTWTVMYQGKERVLIELCRELGISHYRTKDRIRKGWPVDVAIEVAGNMRGIVNNNKRRIQRADVMAFVKEIEPPAAGR